MNTVETVKAIDALLALAINSLVRVQQYSILVETARSEGRDISDEELAALKAESDRLTSEVLAKLDGVR